MVLKTCSEDILVFLTGAEEIEAVAKSIQQIARDLPPGLYSIMAPVGLLL